MEPTPLGDLKATQAWLHEVVVNGHLNYAAANRSVLEGWGGGADGRPFLTRPIAGRRRQH